MQIQTFSVVCGTLACNARCDYCIASMSPHAGLEIKPQPINVRNFKKAVDLAERCGATTLMLTGKGEPTLFPDQITQYLSICCNTGHSFPLTELQTNGITIAANQIKEGTIRDWYSYGLTTIATSIVHYEKEYNLKNFTPNKKDYFNLEDYIKKLHDFGFSVRLNCILNRQAIYKSEDVIKLIDFCKLNKVEQLTLVPVNKPKQTSNSLEVFNWVNENYVLPEDLNNIKNMFDNDGNIVMELNHGATVYDYKGQNVCLSNCLTKDKKDEIRNLIFFPDGHLRYSWEFEGAILL